MAFEPIHFAAAAQQTPPNTVMWSVTSRPNTFKAKRLTIRISKDVVNKAEFKEGDDIKFFVDREKSLLMLQVASSMETNTRRLRSTNKSRKSGVLAIETAYKDTLAEIIKTQKGEFEVVSAGNYALVLQFPSA